MSVIHRNQTTRNYNLSVIQPCVLRSCNDQEVFVMLSTKLKYRFVCSYTNPFTQRSGYAFEIGSVLYEK